MSTNLKCFVQGTDVDDGDDDVAMISNGSMDDMGSDQIPTNIPPILAGAVSRKLRLFQAWYS